MKSTSLKAKILSKLMEGYAIYNNTMTDSQGRTSNKYRIGTPSRKLIAAGYAALGANKVFVKNA